MTFGTDLLCQGETVSRINGYLCTEGRGSNRGREKNYKIGWKFHLNVLPHWSEMLRLVWQQQVMTVVA